MDIKRLTATVSVSPQIMPADMQAVHDAGFRAIICNRPDGEAEDQPPFAQIAAAAEKLGIKAVYQPIVPGEMSDAAPAAFAKALRELPGPVLAFCRSGARSTNLWTLSQAENSSAE